jgi:rhodanese-related sulfurtransferase
MIRPARRWLALGTAALLGCCTQTPTPFVADHQPGAIQARVKHAEEVRARNNAERAARGAPQQGQVTLLPIDAFFERHQAGTVLLYDVRPKFIYHLGSIVGALSWPARSFDAQLPEREAEIIAAQSAGKIVVVYCADPSCPDARTVADRLAQRGHSVAVLEGGWEAWKAAGVAES